MKESQTTKSSGNSGLVPDPEILYTDPQAFKKMLMDQVRARGGTQAVDSKSVFQNLVKQTLEAFLELELEEQIGYGKYAPEGRGSGNSRNGSTSKTVRGDFGEVDLNTPRDRNGEFDPKIVAKRQTSVGNFTDTVVSLYTRGMTTREIEEHVKEIYGIEISPQFVSRATEQLQQQITDWQNRPLERLYPVVFVDGLRVAVRTDKGVLKKCVYTVLGVGVSGKQEVLGLWIEETEGARFWLKVFNDLKARGIQDILILCGDGLTGLPEAVVSAFPATDVQLCAEPGEQWCTKSATLPSSFRTRIGKHFVPPCAPSIRRQPLQPQSARYNNSMTRGASAIRCRSLPGAITGTV